MRFARHRPLGLRTRLTCWTSLVLAASFAAGSAWAHDGLRRVLESGDDDELAREADEILGDRVAARRPGPGPALEAEIRREISAYKAGELIVIVRSEGRLEVTPRTPVALRLASLPAPSGGPRTVTAGPGERYRALARPSPSGEFTLELALSLAGTEATLARFDRLIAAGAGASFLLAIGGSLVLSGLALRPVAASVRTAARLDPVNLAERLPQTGAGDAIDELARTINGLLDRLASYHAQVVRFTADASHEMRGPLGAMRAAVEVTLQRPRSPDEYREVLGSLGEQCERLGSLVNGLLLLASAEAGAAPIEKLPVDLAGLASDVAEMFDPMAEERGIRLSVDARASLIVVGDASRLRQLATNLLENAIRHTPPGGSISVLAAAVGGSAVFQVADTGVGIPAEHLPRIFDRFYRADPGRGAGGSGLGLSISRWIVQAHGGTIEARSRPGEGATFVARFPIGGVEPASGPPKGAAK